MADSPVGAESVHFQHVHLNVTDPAETAKFYKDFLCATDVEFRGVADALFTERSHILPTKVAASSPRAPTSTLAHIGWAGVDGPNEYEWLKNSGVCF